MSVILSLRRIAVLPPMRPGPRPLTRQAIPHLQLDQFPRSGMTEELFRRSLAIPHVLPRQSRMASADTIALCLPDDLANGPADGFIDGHEFCHIHPEGHIHLTLPRLLRDEVVRLGWGEPHPLSNSGILPTLLTVYAPRTDPEINSVIDLIVQSCLYAEGQLQVFTERVDSGNHS